MTVDGWGRVAVARPELGTQRGATMNATELKADLTAKLDALQAWFAAKPCGWRETATPGQLQQWADRERDEAALVERLEMLSE